MFKQMMRSRLPPTSYFVEQLVEGVSEPEGWACWIGLLHHSMYYVGI
jgi:hypothetical protein